MSRRDVAGIALGGAATASVGLSSKAKASDERARELSRQDSISILDFDVDPSGRNDSSTGFRRALIEAGGRRLQIPKGVFLVAGLGGLARAGTQIVGASSWGTVLRSEKGGGSIFANDQSGRGTSAHLLIGDLQLDLDGGDGVGIDLASVNATVIQRVHIKGGASREEARGIGILFSAPLLRGAYDNALYDCTFEYLDRAVVWGEGANNNSVFNCRVTNCQIAYDASPDGMVDTPRIFGGRVEGCGVGLREGASQGAYFGVRFEDNAIADVDFSRQSENAAIFGGYTASTPIAIRNLDLASSPHVDSSELGFRAIEESASRPKISTGRHVFGKAGKTPAIEPGTDYSAYFSDPVVFGQTIRPSASSAVDIGSDKEPFETISLGKGIRVAGKPVIGARQAAIAADQTGSPNSRTINQILDALRAHGLIED